MSVCQYSPVLVRRVANFGYANQRETKMDNPPIDGRVNGDLRIILRTGLLSLGAFVAGCLMTIAGVKLSISTLEDQMRRSNGDMRDMERRQERIEHKLDTLLKRD